MFWFQRLLCWAKKTTGVSKFPAVLCCLLEPSTNTSLAVCPCFWCVPYCPMRLRNLSVSFEFFSATKHVLYLILTAPTSPSQVFGLGLITKTFSIRLSTSSCLLFHWFQSWKILWLELLWQLFLSTSDWKNIKMPNWSSGNIFAKCEQVFRPEGSKYCRSLSKTFQQLYNWLPGFASVMSQTTLPPGNSTPRVVDTLRPRVNTFESWEGRENTQTENIIERQRWVSILIEALLNDWRQNYCTLHVQIYCYY